MGGAQQQIQDCLTEKRLFAAATGKRISKEEQSHIAYCKSCGYLYGTRAITHRKRLTCPRYLYQ